MKKSRKINILRDDLNQLDEILSALEYTDTFTPVPPHPCAATRSALLCSLLSAAT